MFKESVASAGAPPGCFRPELGLVVWEPVRGVCRAGEGSGGAVS